MEKLKKSARYDVSQDMRFHCLVGKTQVILSIMIEPDPHGDGKGTHAHFHTTILCPKMKIVDIPEPDRCQILNRTCPFIAPFGSHRRDPELRKFNYAHKIIHMMASIEFDGTQLLNILLTTKGLARTKENPRLLELTRIMVVSDLINKEEFQKIDKLRKIRNKLAHGPKEYLKFSEKELFELSISAQELSNIIKRAVASLEKSSDYTNR